MREHEKQNLTRSGMFIFIASIVAMIIIIFLGKESSLFSRMYNLKIQTDDAKNLRPGAKVKLKGIKIGKVGDITFKDIDTVEINLSVDAKFQEIIRKNTKASIQTQGMLGDKYVELFGGTADSPATENNSILTIEDKLALDKIVSKGDNILELSTSVLQKVDFFLDQVNNENNISKTLAAITHSTEKLDSILTKVDGDKLARMINNLDRVGTRINKGPGTLYSLLYDQSAYEELRTLLGGAQRNKILKYFIRESIKNTEQVKD